MPIGLYRAKRPSTPRPSDAGRSEYVESPQRLERDFQKASSATGSGWRSSVKSSGAANHTFLKLCRTPDDARDQWLRRGGHEKPVHHARKAAIVLVEPSRLLDRALVYAAITRAQLRAVLIGRQSQFEAAVRGEPRAL